MLITKKPEKTALRLPLEVLKLVLLQPFPQLGETTVNLADHVPVVFAELILVLFDGHDRPRLELSQGLLFVSGFVLFDDALVVRFDSSRFRFVPRFVLGVQFRRLFQICLITQ